MALPIKETPILTGRDADEFVRRMVEAESKPVPRADYERAQRLYESLPQEMKAVLIGL